MFISNEWKNFLNQLTSGQPELLTEIGIPNDRVEFTLMQAFFGGFGACLGTVMNIVDASENEDEQCAKLEAIKGEIESFSAWQRDIAEKNGTPVNRVYIKSGKEK